MYLQRKPKEQDLPDYGGGCSTSISGVWVMLSVFPDGSGSTVSLGAEFNTCQRYTAELQIGCPNSRAQKSQHSLLQVGLAQPAASAVRFLVILQGLEGHLEIPQPG